MQDAEPKRRVMSVSPRMMTMNLDTTANGRRESLHLAPKQVVEVTESQFRSMELQKLLGAKFLVDMTAAVAKRESFQSGR
jgi:hypothetical protein